MPTSTATRITITQTNTTHARARALSLSPTDLHIATLGAPQTKNAGAREHVERERIDALLIDHHESVVLLVTAARNNVM
jgi:hypothetical protein